MKRSVKEQFVESIAREWQLQGREKPPGNLYLDQSNIKNNKNSIRDGSV